MASSFVYWTSDGGGASGRDVVPTLYRWIGQQDNAELIVYGGDVYRDGRDVEFEEFLGQVGGSVERMCQTPGNHDWRDRVGNGSDARLRGYEDFWSAQPASRQPIDTTRRAGARYEHFIDVNGWRLIFLDTGPVKPNRPWPFGDESRAAWLRDALDTPGRSKMVFLHHSRLSWGLHGDNVGVDRVWRELFDEAGRPRVACTMAGHDHNASVYRPRDADLRATDIAGGVQIWVNGAGGAGFYERTTGTPADLYPADLPHDPPTFCVTQIELVDARNARVRLLGLGNPPRSDRSPTVLADFSYAFP